MTILLAPRAWAADVMMTGTGESSRSSMSPVAVNVPAPFEPPMRIVPSWVESVGKKTGSVPSTVPLRLRSTLLAVRCPNRSLNDTLWSVNTPEAKPACAVPSSVMAECSVAVLAIDSAKGPTPMRKAMS